MKKATGLAIVVLLTAASCATLSPLYRQGVQSEIAQRWDEAITYYEKAALMNPTEAVYRLALTQVKAKAGLFYTEEARRLLAEGKKDEARAVYDKARSLDPRNTALVLEIERAFSPKAKIAEAAPAKIEFPIKLKVKEGVLDLRLSSETSLRAVFQSLARAGGINIVFDETFRDMPFQTDFTNVTFEQALATICQATKNFFRIIDERTVIIVPDQPAKRLQYEVSCIRTFYLSNASAQEMTASLTNMLRGPAKVPLIFFDKNLNTITIRDTPRTIELAEKLIKLWDKPKGEVIVDIEIMEVTRSRLKELGLAFDNGYVGLRYGEPAAADSSDSSTTGAWQNLKSIDLGNAANYFTLLPSTYLHFLETDSDTKIIAQPRLRGMADEELRQLVGEKEPVPQTTWNPTAYTTTTTTITSYKYEDVGIDVKLTPKVHYEREVTLSMEIKVTSLGGTGYGDLPRINTREVKNVIRLKDGETTMLTGLLRDSERKSYAGIPLLKDLPLIGRLFGAEDTTIEQTDIIMTITPHIVRTVPINPEDASVLWVDVDTAPTASRPRAGAEIETEPMSVEQDLGETAEPGNRPRRGETNSLLLGPSNLDIPAGREFRITAGVQTDGEIGMISATFAFDPRLLTIKSVASGGMGRSLGENAPFLQNFDNNAGTCMVGFNTPVPGKGVRNGGALAVLVFETKAAGEAVVSVSQITASDPQGLPLTFQTGEARIRIR